MKVIGLSGKAGTGKSHRAASYCKEQGIDGIIDDGLYIFQNTMVVGSSAKYHEYKMGRIRAALFQDDAQCTKVSAAVRNTDPQILLVIGTSDKMVQKICERLAFPLPSEYIHIEDISTPEAIKTAQWERTVNKTHCIPAPKSQLKENAFVKFIRKVTGYRGSFGEMTIVRLGSSVENEKKVLQKIICDLVLQQSFLAAEQKDACILTLQKKKQGLYIVLTLRCRFGYPLKSCLEALQRQILDTLKAKTRFSAAEIHIKIADLA